MIHLFKSNQSTKQFIPNPSALTERDADKITDGINDDELTNEEMNEDEDSRREDLFRLKYGHSSSS